MRTTAIGAREAEQADRTAERRKAHNRPSRALKSTRTHTMDYQAVFEGLFRLLEVPETTARCSTVIGTAKPTKQPSVVG
jgi:hypothetical protein